MASISSLPPLPPLPSLPPPKAKRQSLGLPLPLPESEKSIVYYIVSVSQLTS